MCLKAMGPSLHSYISYAQRGWAHHYNDILGYAQKGWAHYYKNVLRRDGPIITIIY